MRHLSRTCPLLISLALAASGLGADTRHRQTADPLAVLRLATAAVGRMEPGYLRDSIYLETARTQAEAGDLAGAVALAARIDEVETKDAALLAIVQAQDAADPTSSLEIAARITDPDLRGLAEGEAAVVQSTTLALPTAVATAMAIEDEGRRFSAICAIAANLYRLHRTAEADRLLTQNPGVQGVLRIWRDEASRLNLKGLGRDLFDTPVVGYILRQRATEPRIDVDGIHQAIYRFAYGLRDVSQLGEFAALKAKVGDRAATDRLVLGLGDTVKKEQAQGSDGTSTVSLFAIGLLLWQDTADAARVAPLCQRADARSLIYLGIATAHANVGDIGAARTALARVTHPAVRLQALAELARVFSTRNRREAASCLALAEEALRTGSNAEAKSLALASMAEAYSSLGNRPAALAKLAALDRITNGEPLFEVSELVDLHLIAGDIKGARQWAARSPETFARIIEDQAGRRDLAGARDTIALAHLNLALLLESEVPGDEIIAVCRAEARALGTTQPIAWAQTLNSPAAQACAFLGIARGMLQLNAATPPVGAPAGGSVK